MAKAKAFREDSSTLMLAYLCVKECEGLPESVGILDRFGLNDDQIAVVCGAALGSVRNARRQYKKGKKAKRSRAKKAEGGK